MAQLDGAAIGGHGVMAKRDGLAIGGHRSMASIDGHRHWKLWRRHLTS